MAALVWFTTGIALWHFIVFLPDRWWAGIVGALVGAATGAMVTGAIAQIAIGDSIGETGHRDRAVRDPRHLGRARRGLRDRRPPGGSRGGRTGLDRPLRRA